MILAMSGNSIFALTSIIVGALGAPMAGIFVLAILLPWVGIWVCMT